MPTQHHVEVLEQLRSGDMERLQDMLCAAFNSIDPQAIAEHIPRTMAAESAEVIAARDYLGSIASVLIVNIDNGAAELRGRIDDVTTHDDYRQQGYGGAVLDFALDWFKENGVGHVGLTSSDAKKPAHRLYISRGFVMRDTNVFRLDF